LVEVLPLFTICVMPALVHLAPAFGVAAIAGPPEIVAMIRLAITAAERVLRMLRI
jgi:hypothetical protein